MKNSNGLDGSSATTIESGREVAPTPTELDNAASWRRGMRHAIDRIDFITSSRKSSARKKLELIVAALDELWDFSANNSPRNYAEAAEICGLGTPSDRVGGASRPRAEPDDATGAPATGGTGHE